MGLGISIPLPFASNTIERDTVLEFMKRHKLPITNHTHQLVEQSTSMCQAQLGPRCTEDNIIRMVNFMLDHHRHKDNPILYTPSYTQGGDIASTGSYREKIAQYNPSLVYDARKPMPRGPCRVGQRCHVHDMYEPTHDDVWTRCAPNDYACYEQMDNLDVCRVEYDALVNCGEMGMNCQQQEAILRQCLNDEFTQ